MSEVHLERELKFSVPDGFTVPDLTSLPGVASAENEVVNLESVYYDTAGRDLLEAGLTLRRRTGDTDTGWQLKVPAGASRSEVHVPLGGRGVPVELRELTAGIRGRAALRPIATLRTCRHIRRVRAADGTELAEIADDTVTSHTEREFAITRNWREVEIELKHGRPKILGRAARLLRDHGATDATIGSKLLHALGIPGLPERDRTTLAGVVASYLDEQFEALVAGDVMLRRGDDVVHPTRVATRRYRSVLRVFADRLDPVRTQHLDHELRWFAAALGGLRDVQVLRRHLDRALDELPAELVTAAVSGSVSTTIGEALDAQESDARAELDEHLGSARHVALMRELRAWRQSIPLTGDASATAVADYVAKAERTSAKRLRQARGSGRNDEAYHRARKAAKRARYVAELSEPVLGAKARKAAQRAHAIQQRFGDRQDNVMAGRFLRELGLLELDVRPAGGDAFVLGVMYARERAAIE